MSRGRKRAREDGLLRTIEQLNDLELQALHGIIVPRQRGALRFYNLSGDLPYEEYQMIRNGYIDDLLKHGQEVMESMERWGDPAFWLEGMYFVPGTAVEEGLEDYSSSEGDFGAMVRRARNELVAGFMAEKLGALI